MATAGRLPLFFLVSSLCVFDVKLHWAAASPAEDTETCSADNSQCKAAEGELRRDDTSALCCAETALVDVLKLNNSGKHEIAIVDGVFCPRFLATLQEATLSLKSKMRREQDGGFPGIELDFEKAAAVAKRMNKSWAAPFQALARGDHLKCLQRALELAGMTSTASRLKLFGRGKAKNREGGVVSALNGPIRTSAMHVDCDGESRREVHVVNIHLSRNFTDTGTSFWRILAGKEFQVQGKGGQLQTFRTQEDIDWCSPSTSKKCYGAIMALAQAWRKHAQDGETTKGEGELMDYEHDFTGGFEKYATAMVRPNRAILYSGSLLHAGYFPPEAVQRTLRNSMASALELRFVTQDFISVPGTEDSYCEVA